MIMKSSRLRASHANSRRSHISPVSTTCLPSRCPHRLFCTWSSMCNAAAPAISICCTVLAMLGAEPHPVSQSTSIGKSQTEVIRRTSSTTSVNDVMPRSCNPYDAVATPLPLR